MMLPRSIAGTSSSFGNISKPRHRIYPSAISEQDVQNGLVDQPYLTPQDLKMLEIINQITDQDGWEVDACNDQTIADWKADILDLESDLISEDVANRIFSELRSKAKLLKEPSIQGAVTVFSGLVVKSGARFLNELGNEMNDLVRPLEDVPPSERDYRSDSRERLVYLVNPSLYTPINMKSKGIRPDRPPLGLDDFFSRLGDAHMINVPLTPAWLPCEVVFDAEKPKITSYINNLHPIKHRQLYHSIEQVLCAAIPAWNLALLALGSLSNTKDDSPSYDAPDAYLPNDLVDSDLLRQFKKSGLQVVVEMTNVELTIAKPEFMGENWHLAGGESDSICAIAHYFYSCENITEPRLAFRQRSKAINPVPEESPNDFYLTTLQVLGEIEALQGRLITFTNTLQTQLQKFNLKDRTNGGHLKILTLYLVDPGQKSMSTSKVLPQQKAWYIERAEQLKASGLLGDPENKFFADLLKQAGEDEPYFSSNPYSFPISLNEVKYRGKAEGEARRYREHRLSYLFEHGRPEGLAIEESGPVPTYVP